MDKPSSQRILAIELRPVSGGIEGTLVLPFGLELAKGASFQIDDGQVGAPVAFRTCLPIGCTVPVTFDGSTVTALRSGTALKIKTTRDGGDELLLSISLKGFGGALDRTIALLR